MKNDGKNRRVSSNVNKIVSVQVCWMNDQVDGRGIKEV